MHVSVLGLATMGANLARNCARRGHDVVVYNRTAEKTDEFLRRFGSEGKLRGAKTLQELVSMLPVPRIFILMVKAGSPVDQLIRDLTPLLSKGDILIDGGNSLYLDTARRESECAANGIHFVGMGISGGEEGALLGPSIMPGGSKEAYDVIEPLVRSIAAQDGANGTCVTHVGTGGAGHFVKMVHNGIEYGVMQLLCEAYHLLKSVGYANQELAVVFKEWSTADDLSSFLVEITADIFATKDKETGRDLVDLILDAAGQKGTGKWTTDAAMTYGVAVPTITAAVDARIVSSAKDLRVQMASGANFETIGSKADKRQLLADVRRALDCSILNDYAQGFELIRAANDVEKWGINQSEVARIWRGGCIIRSKVVEEYQHAFAGDKEAGAGLRARCEGQAQKAWRRVVAYGASMAIPLPAMSASLSYFDGYRTERLPQNLLQAQRDNFGAHTYKRVDAKGTYHANWKTGEQKKLTD